MHGDLGDKHIFIEDCKVVAIIDFEQAQSGDPIMDFANWDFWYNILPVEHIFEGYDRKEWINDNFEIRLKLNSLLGLLKLVT